MSTSEAVALKPCPWCKALPVYAAQPSDYDDKDGENPWLEWVCCETVDCAIYGVMMTPERWDNRADLTTASLTAITQIVGDHCSCNRNETCPECHIRAVIAADKEPIPDALVDEVQRRMDAVVDAAVAWHRSGDEWTEAANALDNAIDQLLELRSAPAATTASEKCVKCGCTGGTDENGWCMSGRPYIANLPDSNKRSICACKCEFPTADKEPTPLPELGSLVEINRLAAEVLAVCRFARMVLALDTSRSIPSFGGVRVD